MLVLPHPMPDVPDFPHTSRVRTLLLPVRTTRRKWKASRSRLSIALEGRGERGGGEEGEGERKGERRRK